MVRLAYLGILQEAEFEVYIHLNVLRLGATDGGDDDHRPLLTLELLYRPDLDVAVATLLQNPT